MAKAIIRMPDELHRALKVESARRGIPMQELATAAIERLLATGDKAGSTVATKKTRSALGVGELANEEAELVNGLLKFMREEKDPLRAATLRVIRAALEEHLGRRQRAGRKARSKSGNPSR